MIELRDVYKHIGLQPLLEDVSLVLPRKGAVCLAGNNGAGKTSLLRVLAGVLLPDSGTILYEGKRAAFDGSLLRAKCGYQPPGEVSLPNVTVKDLLRLSQELGGMVPPEGKAAPAAIASMFGLAGCMDHSVRALSSGYKRRLVLACAACRNPEVLICDEPWNTLDRDMLTGVSGFLAEYAKDRLVVFSTHGYDTIMALADVVYLMENGCVSDMLELNGLAPDTRAGALREFLR